MERLYVIETPQQFYGNATIHFVHEKYLTSSQK